MISVIMSVYKEEKKWIKEAIESILNQTYKEFQYIITLDNPDNIEIKNFIQEYAQKDKRIEYIINEKNQGLTWSLNNMLKHAKGTYIARMDADDISLSTRLEKQLKYAIENNVDIVGTNVIQFNDEDQCTSNLYLSDYEIKKNIKRGAYLPHPTWFVKKEIYNSLGGYREINYAEDYDFTLRAISKGYKLNNMQEPLVKYRINNNSISRKNALKQKLTSIYLSDNMSQINSITQEDINIFINKHNKKNEEKYANGEKDYIKFKQSKDFKTKVKALMSLFFCNFIYLKYNKIRNFKLIFEDKIKKG